MMRQFELVERVKAYDPEADEDLLNRAYVYGVKAHGNQKRDSGDPYFSHPIEVAATERDHLAQWLSNRLSRSVTPPALDALGYRLIGGRLLATVEQVLAA